MQLRQNSTEGKSKPGIEFYLLMSTNAEDGPGFFTNHYLATHPAYCVFKPKMTQHILSLNHL